MASGGSMDQYGVFGVAILAHFCELHGPSIVFCTQMVHPYSPIMGVESITADPVYDQRRAYDPAAEADDLAFLSPHTAPPRPSTMSMNIGTARQAKPTPMSDGSFVQPDPFASVQRPTSIANVYLSPMNSERSTRDLPEEEATLSDEALESFADRDGLRLSFGGVESGHERREENPALDEVLLPFVRRDASGSTTSDFSRLSGQSPTRSLSESGDSDLDGVPPSKPKRPRIRSFGANQFPLFDPFNRVAGSSSGSDAGKRSQKARSVAGGDSSSTRNCSSCSSIEDGQGFMSVDAIGQSTGNGSQFSTMSTSSVAGGHFSGLAVSHEGSQGNPDLRRRAFRYFSTRDPCSALYSSCRRAVVRALSCEVCEGREGPLIWFDPQSHLHVLSYAFKIYDIEARGHMRYYSLMVLLHDGSLLMAAHHTIVAHLQKVIQQLRRRSKERFDAEEEAKREKERHGQRGGASTAQHSSHAMALGRGRADMVNARYVGGGGLATNPAFRRTMGRPASRSLVELLQYRHLYKDVHVAFSQTLRVVAGHLQEKFLVSTINPATEAASSLLPEEDESEGDPYQQGGSEVTYRQVVDALGMEGAIFVFYHVLVGNQVVIRGPNRLLVLDILQMLQRVTPSNCHVAPMYSGEYLESYKVNLLGVPPHTPIPDHVDESSICVIDCPSLGELQVLQAANDKTARRSLQILAEKGVARARGSVPVEEAVVGSVYDRTDDETDRLVQMEEAAVPSKRSLTLRPFSMTDDSFHTSLGLALVNTLSMSEASSEKSGSLQCQIEVLLQEWVCKSKLFYKLSKTVKNKRDERVPRFYEVLNLMHEADVKVLRFFTTGFRKTMLRSQIWEAFHPT